MLLQLMDKLIKIASLSLFIQQFFVKPSPHIGNGRHTFAKDGGYPFHRNGDFGQVTKPDFLRGDLRIKEAQASD